MAAAIKRALDSVKGPQSPLALATGGIHLVTAPRNATYPYIVITLTGGIIEETFSDGRWEPVELQIDIWDEHKGDVTKALAIDAALIDALHDKNISLTDGNTALIMRARTLPTTDYDEQYVRVMREWVFERQTYTV